MLRLSPPRVTISGRAGIARVVLLVSLLIGAATMSVSGGDAAPAAASPILSLGQRTTASVAGSGAPRPNLRLLVGAIRFPGRISLPFPSVGESAVYIPGYGVLGSFAGQRSRPIASLTKVMTALIVLRDHPLAGGEGGPELTMTEEDYLGWMNAVANGESNVEVLPGEKIDELQLLEALLVASACNIADTLARWDAGSTVAFVAKMNDEARRLGLSRTHYADSSGLDPRSESTAVDQALLAGVAMKNPVFRLVVDLSSVVLPVVGRVLGWNPALGVDGIVGVKSGFTGAAQDCLVTAAWRNVGGRNMLVISSTLGQSSLDQAATVDEALLQAASAQLVMRTVYRDGQVVGVAEAPWSGRTSRLEVSRGPLSVVGWPGLVLNPELVPLPVRDAASHGYPKGSAPARIQVREPGGVAVSALTILERWLPPPAAK